MVPMSNDHLSTKLFVVSNLLYKILMYFTCDLENCGKGPIRSCAHFMTQSLVFNGMFITSRTFLFLLVTSSPLAWQLNLFLETYSQTWNFLELRWTQRVWDRQSEREARQMQGRSRRWTKGGWEGRNIDLTSFYETNVVNFPWGGGHTSNIYQ